MAEIKEITIKQLSKLIREKDISIKEVTQEYIDRINRIDQGEEGLNSVIEINPDAITIAEKLDEQRTVRDSELYGIPILLKDNIDTAGRMHTSAGSLALADSVATDDAEIVRILRSKGALILGKTNMTEFANYMTKGMPPGYSSRGGQVKSPYKKGADPSGSSTGSAVAVAANLCTAALGTDTSGSIISPAIKNGLVGFRPSIGALSQRGIIPISFTCDTAGPMARTVMDAAIIFTELSGITLSNDVKMEGNITVAVNDWDLKNLDAEEGKKAETILKDIEKTGITIKQLTIEPLPQNNIKTIQKYEFKYSINRYLTGLPKDYSIRTLEDIIEFNRQDAAKTLVYGQTLLEDALENTKGDMSESEYIHILEDRERSKIELFEKLKDINACILFKENMRLQYVGIPSITIPHGLHNDGMPYGITLTTLNDMQLLKYALKIEQLIGRRVPPNII